jgi:hypothetical protein
VEKLPPAVELDRSPARTSPHERGCAVDRPSAMSGSKERQRRRLCQPDEQGRLSRKSLFPDEGGLRRRVAWSNIPCIRFWTLGFSHEPSSSRSTMRQSCSVPTGEKVMISALLGLGRARAACPSVILTQSVRDVYELTTSCKYIRQSNDVGPLVPLASTEPCS